MVTRSAGLVSSTRWRDVVHHANWLPPALAISLGVLLFLLPYLLWWPLVGAPQWIGHNDDLIYLSYIAQAYHRHPFFLADPLLPSGGTGIYPWLQFIPPILVSKFFGWGPMGVPVLWHLWGGITITLGWYLLFRQHWKSAVLSAAFAVFMISDVGLFTCHVGYRQLVYLWHLLIGPSNILLQKDLGLPLNWRILTPSASFFFLQAFLYSVVSMRANSTRNRTWVCGIIFGLLFYTYFYYWTTAAVALIFLMIIDRSRKTSYLRAGLLGTCIGIPWVIHAIWIKQAHPPDWLVRHNFFSPSERFASLILPKIAILIIVLSSVYVWRRHRSALPILVVGVAAFLLSNHQVLTGYQTENFHWNYVWGASLSFLTVHLLRRAASLK